MKLTIAMFLALSMVLPLCAQDSASNTPQSSIPLAEHQYRNPHRALVLGALIPGAGHIYAGEYLKGILTYEATVGAIGLGVLVFLINNCTFALFTECKQEPAWPHQVLGVAVAGAGVWEWIASARDARHAAERANERHRRQSASVEPIVDPFTGPRHLARLGIALRW